MKSHIRESLNIFIELLSIENVNIRCCFIVFIFVCLNIKAIPFETVVLPQQNLLPTSAINRIFVDSEGFIWYGTEDFGLIRDDGYLLSEFRTGLYNPEIILSNHVTCITESSTHNILFGTKRGLYIIDKQNYSVKAFPDKEIRDWDINAILVAHDGTLWVSTNNSVIHYNNSYQRIVENGLSRTPSKYNGEWKKVHALCEIGTDVWALQEGGVPLVFEHGTGKPKQQQWPMSDSPASVCNISSVYAILSVKNGGLYLYNKVKHSYTQILLSDNAKGIIAMSFDKRRRLLWCISKTELHVYKMESPTNYQIIKSLNHLPPMQPQAIALTTLGQAWIVSLYANSVVAYLPILPSVRISLPQVPSNDFVTIAPTTACIQNSKLWYCQKDQGLYCYDISSKSLQRIPSKGMASQVLVNLPNRHSLYAVYDNRDIVHIDTRQPLSANSCLKLAIMPKFQYVHDMKFDGHQTLWVGAMNGLYALDIKTHKLIKKSTPVSYINTIVINNNGCLFLGTEKNGVYRYDPVTGLTTNYKPKDNVTRMALDVKGNVWWASISGDIFMLDTKNNFTTKNMTNQLGLNHDKIVGITSDAKGNLWVLCSKSLHIYNTRTNTTTILYGNSKELDFNTMFDISNNSDGKIIIAGDGGFRIFDKVFINTITNNLKTCFTAWKQKDSIHLLSCNQQRIILPSDDRNIEIFFSSLNHLYAKETRYAYRYDGDKKWQMLPVGQNYINLLQMSRGNHTLEVKCTNALGQWSETSSVVAIYCTPMWYETDLAFSVYTILFVISCFVLVRFYVNRKKQKLAKENMANSAQDVQEIIEKITNDLSTADNEFVNKVQKLIEQNVNNSEYTVEQLSADLAMERTGLYRKMMSTMGKSPAKYIRSIRLKRAATLLIQGYKVSDAAYNSGFGTAKYMSRCFQQEFGMTPTEYIEKHRQKESK